MLCAVLSIYGSVFFQSVRLGITQGNWVITEIKVIKKETVTDWTAPVGLRDGCLSNPSNSI